MPMLLPPRRPMPPPRPAAPPAATQEPDTQADDVPVEEGFLNFGTQAQQAVHNSQEANQFRGYREFFITKGEVEDAAKRGEAGCTVRAHFVRNYANANENVSVGRCSISVGQNRSESYTSAGSDCALAAAGVPVSVRPVYVLVDHRVYQKKDGTKGTDDVKLWIPPPNILSVMENAIKNLCENTGIDRLAIDITKYEAKITKIGVGTKTTWAIDFMVKPVPLSKAAQDSIAKTLEKGYKATMAKWLAPNPKYMISRGGTYVRPPKHSGSFADAGSESVPY